MAVTRGWLTRDRAQARERERLSSIPGRGSAFLSSRPISGLKMDLSIKGKPVCQIQAHVDSVNLGFLFRMNNHFTSVVEIESFTPIRYVKEIDQRGFLRETKNYRQTLTFDTNKGRVVVEQKGERERFLFPPTPMILSPCSHDTI